MSTLLIIILFLLFFGGLGAAPMWGAHTYGWGPSGGIGFILIVILILALTGRL